VMRAQRLTAEELRAIRERAEAYNRRHNAPPRMPPRSTRRQRPPHSTGSGPHAVLGVRPGATREEIRSAYRALAMRHHPDHGGDAEKMRSINEAYRVIVGSCRG
jgi:DnaJ-domain-containing protein 1